MVVQKILGVSMIFGVSDAPCSNAHFMCIGKMGAEEIKVHAANIFPILVVLRTGCILDILFRDAPTHDVVWKSTNFKDIRGK